MLSPNEGGEAAPKMCWMFLNDLDILSDFSLDLFSVFLWFELLLVPIEGSLIVWELPCQRY